MRFPFVATDETNCFTDSFDAAYTDCLVVRKYTFLDVLDLCYLGLFFQLFSSVSHSASFPSPVHTQVYTHTPAAQVQLLPLWFVWFSILHSILACCGQGFSACQSLAGTGAEFSKF